MKQGLAEQGVYREQENSHLEWPDHTEEDWQSEHFETKSISLFGDFRILCSYVNSHDWFQVYHL